MTSTRPIRITTSSLLAIALIPAAPTAWAEEGGYGQFRLEAHWGSDQPGAGAPGLAPGGEVLGARVSDAFVDVPPSHPFHDFISTFADLAITSGCSTSPPMYCPESAVTRGQMAVFMVKLYNLLNPVVASYAATMPQFLSPFGSVIDFDAPLIDTHAAVTTGSSWVFTAPVDGYYAVHVHLAFEESNEWMAGCILSALLRRNSVTFREVVRREMSGPGDASGFAFTGNGSTVVELGAGDTTSVLVFSNCFPPVTLDPVATDEKTFIDIHLVGQP